jgi:hypothetical protein
MSLRASGADIALSGCSSRGDAHRPVRALVEPAGAGLVATSPGEPACCVPALTAQIARAAMTMTM